MKFVKYDNFLHAVSSSMPWLSDFVPMEIMNLLYKFAYFIGTN